MEKLKELKKKFNFLKELMYDKYFSTKLSKNTAAEEKINQSTSLFTETYMIYIFVGMKIAINKIHKRNMINKQNYILKGVIK